MASATKAVLAALYHSRLHKVMARFTRGAGAILMLHRVEPDTGAAFAPNAGLTVTPEFLEAVIIQVKAAGFDIVNLDEALSRLSYRELERPFVAITFDDGYRDNFELAFPVLRRHEAPFTIYVPTDFPEGKGILWWITIERIIAAADGVLMDRDGETLALPATTTSEKLSAFDTMTSWYTSLDQDARESWIRQLCHKQGFDASALTKDLIMSWDEIRKLNTDPLVTIGAHTMSHPAVAKLSRERARAEIHGSLDRLEVELGERPRHFSFPYGTADAAGPRDFSLLGESGVKTGVTTRGGMLSPAAGDKMTALPRLSINGNFQDLRFTEVLLSGLPFALRNKLGSSSD